MNTNSLKSSSEYGSRIQLIAILLSVFAMLILFTSGCATVGQDFSVVEVSEIEIGSTNQNEIRAMFGSPWRVGIEDGQRTWTYGKYSYGLFGARQAKDLVIRFDERKIVTSYTFSTTEHNE